ncbi:hypothetical protein FC83_GL000248 [Agrilactobacillus composti DSM 18527 = JCM 14202]|uniref:Electron transfer flavoprotein subunit alpha n=1 Tax=Agrilactobacillus composti DSM 18527 = JCM 14202 TaxID=1423734 RepID=X0PS04_9LACO|nr:electron transfer flavoprotein subunit alpha/FixB family protein [Agrilactobacillus composti]KRM32844.1 hypothetical protein FC83_GL000248 [Agrilactobacillus composti DSM 18527 = JCM 14202]GAF40652.1 electron transfer flavoprotein, alpha subunit [Agrilactobacillus composti DSM 18527 = JCM 14202]
MGQDTIYLVTTTGDTADVEALQAVAQANFPEKQTRLVVFESNADKVENLKTKTANTVDAIDFLAISGLDYPDPNVLGKAFVAYFKNVDTPLILLNSSRFNNAVAARIAAGLTASIVTDIEQPTIDGTNLIVSKKGYSGELKRQVQLDMNGGIVLTVNPLKDPVKLPTDKDTVVQNIASEVVVTLPEDATYTLTTNDQDLNLDNAEVVVAGGRGLKSEAGFKELYQLGKIMNAAVGASRPVVDSGWADSSLMIGQSGKSISPKVYFAFGISGTVQHTIGIENAKCIVAINSDKDAPIFKLADYGIIGDAKAVIQQLVTSKVSN